MLVHEAYSDLKLREPFVTIGVFDGVHRGHRALLDRLVYGAKKNNSESAVITFNPHPRLILGHKNEKISYLSTLAEKKTLLKKSCIDHLIIMNFNKDVANTEAKGFVREVLVKKIGIRHLIVGYDNHFGKSKGGNFSNIREYADLYGFTAEQVEGVSGPGGMISSTAIREALLAGNLEFANDCLGYHYSVTGEVIRGRGLGRKLGFPTANIRPDDSHKLIPSDGVYAVEIMVGSDIFPGVLSIGFNPTVDPGRASRSIEANIFNFDGNLYGKTVTLFFKYRLREERKFDNMDQLTRQMEADRNEALRLLK